MGRSSRAAVIRLVVGAVVALTVVVLLAAPLFGAVRAAPFAVAFAGRRMILAGLAMVAIAWLVWALVRRARRAERGFAIAMTAVLLGTLVAYFAGARTTTPGVAGEDSSSSLRILIWNTNQQAVPAEDIIALIRQTDPDLVVLPEYFGQISKSVTSGLPRGKYTTTWWIASSATILVDQKLGPYKVVAKGVPPWAGFVAEPTTAGSDSPKLVIAHLQRPSLFSTGLWNEHLAWAARACTGANVVAAGDFNTSSENLGPTGLGGCVDVASELGMTGTASWPTALPPALGTQIDRVMAGSDWKAVDYEVIGSEDQAGSDHRPVVVDLQRVGD